MAKLKENLWNILQHLKEDDFDKFKWFLKQDNMVDGLAGIPVARLEKAYRLDVVDLLVQTYQGHGALTLTKEVLKKISRNDLVERLVNSSPETKDLENNECVVEKKKAELRDEIHLMMEERKTKIREIKLSAELSSRSAVRQITDSRRAFDVLQQALKDSLDQHIRSIKDKQETTEKQAQELVQELEREVSELRQREAEVDKQQPDFVPLPHTKTWTDFSLAPPSYGASVVTTVAQLEEILRRQKEAFIAKSKLNRVQQFAKDVRLDPDTAHPNLSLSDDGKQVSYSVLAHSRKDSPQRFDLAVNVLGKQIISSGRFYYQVQVEGKTSWDLGVVKDSIVRKGSIKASPEKGYWTICLRPGQKYQASGIHLHVQSQPNKVGVFVDYEKRSVSFFNVESAEMIHTFTDCSFTEKLSPLFSPGLPLDGANSAPLLVFQVSY